MIDVFPSREQQAQLDVITLANVIEEGIAVLRRVHDNVLMDREVEATLNEINMQIWQFQIALNWIAEERAAHDPVRAGDVSNKLAAELSVAQGMARDSAETQSGSGPSGLPSAVPARDASK
jgi:hypothetical protein